MIGLKLGGGGGRIGGKIKKYEKAG